MYLSDWHFNVRPLYNKYLNPYFIHNKEHAAIEFGQQTC